MNRNLFHAILLGIIIFLIGLFLFIFRMTLPEEPRVQSIEPSSSGKTEAIAVFNTPDIPSMPGTTPVDSSTVPVASADEAASCTAGDTVSPASVSQKEFLFPESSGDISHGPSRESTSSPSAYDGNGSPVPGKTPAPPQVPGAKGREVETALSEDPGNIPDVKSQEEVVYRSAATEALEGETMEAWIPEEAIPEGDPWADWYIAGESDLLLPDGQYFMELYINSTYFGSIETLIEGDSAALSAATLSAVLAEELEPMSYAMIVAYPGGFIPLDYLETQLGAKASFDSFNFIVSLEFGVDAMPERNISLRQQFRSPLSQLAVGGAVSLEPATLGWATTFQLHNLLNVKTTTETSYRYTAALTMAHKLVFLGIGLDVSHFLSYSVQSGSTQSDSFVSSLGSWRGFKDFPDKNLRFSFGNIGGLSGSGSSLGFMLQKSYAYGTGSAKSLSYEHVIELDETSDVRVTINGRQVYQQRLTTGTYRLRDFVLSQGANTVVVRITPVDNPDKVREFVASYGYDSSLLGYGDSLYGISLSVPREFGERQDGKLNLPWFGKDRYISYDLEKLSFQAWQKVGVTNSLSITTTLGSARDLFFGNVASTKALSFGVLTSQIGFSITSQEGTRQRFDEIFGFEGVVGFRFLPGRGFLAGPLALSLSYSTKGYNTVIPTETDLLADHNPISLGASFGGSLGTFGTYSLSMNAQAYLSQPQRISGGATISIGASLGSSLSVSGSVSITGGNLTEESSTVSGSISFTWVPLRNLSLSTSTTIPGTTNVSASYRPSPSGSDLFSASVTDISFAELLSGAVFKPALQFSWTRSTPTYALSFRQSAATGYEDFTTSLLLSTSLVFADGSFGITRSVGENVLLVSPVGQLRGAKVSMARTGDSSAQEIPTLLGSAVYSRLSSNTSNSVVAYTSDSSAFGSGGSFIYQIDTLSRQFFRARIDLPRTMTITGIIYGLDGKPLSQYSAPISRIEADENGTTILVRRDEYYMFTDFDGRYILGDMVEGTYVTDLQVGDEWYALVFTVKEPEDGKTNGLVFIYEDLFLADVRHSAETDEWWENEGFIGHIEIHQTQSVTEDILWEQLFSLPEDSFLFE